MLEILRKALFTFTLHFGKYCIKKRHFIIPINNSNNKNFLLKSRGKNADLHP